MTTASEGQTGYPQSRILPPSEVQSRIASLHLHDCKTPVPGRGFRAGSPDSERPSQTDAALVVACYGVLGGVPVKALRGSPTSKEVYDRGGASPASTARSQAAVRRGSSLGVVAKNTMMLFDCTAGLIDVTRRPISSSTAVNAVGADLVISD